MRHLQTTALTGLLLASLYFPVLAEPPKSYSVTGMKAHFYYDDNGGFGSDDLFKVSEGNLFNSMIGEGIASRPANVTLILVELAGPSFANRDVGNLNIKAYTDVYKNDKTVRTLIGEQNIDLNNFFQEHAQKISIPFLLYRTGISEITIVAILKGGKDAGMKVTTLTRKLLFAGGE